MAGDWIKVDHTLPGKPEIDRMAAVLGIDHDAVVGKLVRFWIWADQQSVNGDALSVTETFIDRVADQKLFADALKKVGWLIKIKGGFSIPNFDRHNGKSAKSRALTKNRMQRSRDDGSVTDASPEKRREEIESPNGDSITPLPPKGEESRRIKLPDVLQTDEFKKAWSDWVQFRREKKKPLTPQMVEKQIASFAEWGPGRAIAAINFTILKGWQGLQEPTNDENSRRTGISRPGSNGNRSPNLLEREQQREAQQLDILRQFVEGDGFEGGAM